MSEIDVAMTTNAGKVTLRNLLKCHAFQGFLLMKEYIKDQFKHFEWEDILPRRTVSEAVCVFIAWAIPSFSFVLWSNIYYPNVEFYQSAINEGIGPNLWNAIASFGFFAFGLAIILSKYTWTSIIARHILSNTYAIGCLSFGLLLGQWWLMLFDPQYIWWHRGVFGVTSGFLLVIAFLYNMVIWYMYFLIRNESGSKSSFLFKLEQMNFFWRFLIGSVLILIVSIIFLSEK